MKLEHLREYFFKVDTSRNNNIEAEELNAAQKSSSIFSSIIKVGMNYQDFMQEAVERLRPQLEIDDLNSNKNLPYRLEPSSNKQEKDWDVATRILLKEEIEPKRFDINTAEDTPMPAEMNFNTPEGKYMLKHLSFTETSFKNIPKKNLPEGFDVKQIIESGKNPGVNTKSMHAMGYTGKGVKVAIIDTPILTEHSGIKTSLKGYEVMNTAMINDNDANFHGQAVADILCGDESGVAPDSDLVYFAESSSKDRLQALKRIVEINKNSAPEERIKILSISWDFDEDAPEYGEYSALLKQLANDGVFISTAGFSMLDESVNGVKINYGILEKNDATGNPDDFSNYTGHSNFGDNTNALLIPAGDRTVASARDVNQYRHDSIGSTSWTTPALSGFYACALQCAKENGVELTPEKFYTLALETGVEIKNNGESCGKAINAQALCEKIIELAKQEHSFGL